MRGKMLGSNSHKTYFFAKINKAKDIVSFSACGVASKKKLTRQAIIKYNIYNRFLYRGNAKWLN